MIFLARNQLVKRFMQNRAALSALAKQFVGGRNALEAAEKAAILKSKGFNCSLFNLGEYIEDEQLITQTVDELKLVIRHLAQSHLDVHISVDPTQIGYQLDIRLCREHAFDLAREIKMVAENSDPSTKNLLMLDMEDATVTQTTVNLYEDLRIQSFPAAITLQAYLYRTQSDLAKVIQAGGAARLVKGAFAERMDIAFTNRRQIDKNYIKLAEMMLSQEARRTGFYPIFGTHDNRLIDKIINMARRGKWKKNEYEFEMLYGVRSMYQEQLVRAGQRLRLYLPFGTDWWPYAVRRVGESPKNSRFLLKSLIGAYSHIPSSAGRALPISPQHSLPPAPYILVSGLCGRKRNTGD